MKTNGEYDKIYNKWFGVYESKNYIMIVIAIVIVSLILIIIAFYITNNFRKKRNSARRELQDSYEQLQLALNAGDISAWIYNMAEKIIFPLSKSELVTDNVFIQNFLDKIDDSDREKVEKAINKVATNCDNICNICFKTKYLCENGLEKYFESKMKSIAANQDHPMLIVGTLKDVSEEVNTRKRLMALKEKAEMDNKMKSAFLANMSHDLRTPLNAIKGFNAILNGRDQIDMPLEERETILNIIDNNINVVITLVNDVLDMAKIESGTYMINYSDVNVNEVCRTCIANVSKLVHPGVRLIYNNVPDDTMLRTDAVRFQQVITNYLTNACKYTSKGSITLSSETIDGVMRFSVTDTGKGIKAEDTETCFDQFIMLKNSASGTGLGLHICKIIAKLLEGRVYVDKSYDKGARFVFEIPLNK